jgi:hypothetical protein
LQASPVERQIPEATRKTGWQQQQQQQQQQQACSSTLLPFFLCLFPFFPTCEYLQQTLDFLTRARKPGALARPILNSPYQVIHFRVPVAYVLYTFTLKREVFCRSSLLVSTQNYKHSGRKIMPTLAAHGKQQ